jgi:NhaA family Na+:H+ antiporter
VFLLTLAVADDVGSVVALLCFYNTTVRVEWLAAGLGLGVAMAVWRRLARRAAPVVLALGLAAWWAWLHAGVEAAVIGVALGALAPPGRRPGAGPLHWERRLAPWVNALVLPVFALANAGLAVTGSGLGSSAARRVFAAVVAARLVGKPVGIAGARWVARRMVPTGRDIHLAGRHLAGLAATATIGFTIPLLVIERAFGAAAASPSSPTHAAAHAAEALAAGATAGLLVASAAGWLGAVVLLRTRRRPGASKNGAATPGNAGRAGQPPAGPRTRSARRCR